MYKFFSRIVAGILGIALAIWLLPEIQVKILADSNFFGIPLTTKWHIIVLLGIIFGVINTFVKPILETLALPLKVLTLGLFSLIINVVIIWGVDLIFQEITVPWFWPLFWTTIIIGGLNIILPTLFKKSYNNL